MTKRKFKPQSQTFPSKEFSLHTKIQGLYTDWIMPNGLTPDEAAEVVLRWNMAEPDTDEEKNAEIILQAFYNSLITENPMLYRIEATTVGQVYDICMGAISKFTVEDIEFFALQSKPELIAFNRGNNKLKDKIEEKCGMFPQWILCPHNLQRVKTLLRIVD